jgi:hypothetical protein
MYQIELWLKRVMHRRLVKLKYRPAGKLEWKACEVRLLWGPLVSMGGKVTLGVERKTNKDHHNGIVAC